MLNKAEQVSEQQLLRVYGVDVEFGKVFMTQKCAKCTSDRSIRNPLELTGINARNFPDGTRGVVERFDEHTSKITCDRK